MLAALSTILAGEIAETVKRRLIAIALLATGALFGLLALAFALVSLRIWLIRTYALSYPDLWIALGLLIVALIFVFAGQWKQNQKAPPSDALKVAAIAAAPTAMRLASKGLNLKLVALGAIVAGGMWAGRKLSKGE